MCQCTTHDAPAAPKPEFTCDVYQQLLTHQGLASTRGKEKSRLNAYQWRAYGSTASHNPGSVSSVQHIMSRIGWEAPSTTKLCVSVDGLECVCILGPHIVCNVCIAQVEFFSLSLCRFPRGLALLILAEAPLPDSHAEF